MKGLQMLKYTFFDEGDLGFRLKLDDYSIVDVLIKELEALPLVGRVAKTFERGKLSYISVFYDRIKLMLIEDSDVTAIKDLIISIVDDTSGW